MIQSFSKNVENGGDGMRVGWKILFAPALLLVCCVLAFGRGEVWQYLSLAALFCCWMGDALRLRLPAATRCVREPDAAARLVYSAADAVFCAALARAMEAMPSRHLRTPGTLYGVELVSWLAPVFVLLGLLVWLWWVFRQVLARRTKLSWLLALCARGLLAGMALCAAFIGNGVRPLCALGGMLLAVSKGMEAAFSAANHLEEGICEDLIWATHLSGLALLMLGLARLY